MLSDQVDGSLGADPLDGATVVTAQQNTQVNKLVERWQKKNMRRKDNSVIIKYNKCLQISQQRALEDVLVLPPCE